jgi:hypothetical protein
MYPPSICPRSMSAAASADVVKDVDAESRGARRSGPRPRPRSARRRRRSSGTACRAPPRGRRRCPASRSSRSALSETRRAHAAWRQLGEGSCARRARAPGRRANSTASAVARRAARRRSGAGARGSARTRLDRGAVEVRAARGRGRRGVGDLVGRGRHDPDLRTGTPSSWAQIASILVCRPCPISVPPWLSCTLPSVYTSTSAPAWLSTAFVNEIPNFTGMNPSPRLISGDPQLNASIAARRAA